MQTHLEKHHGFYVLSIAGDMTLNHANELKKILIQALTTCQQLEINLTQVSELDSAGLQLLILVKREAIATTKTLHLIAHSSAVVEALELTGIAGFFGDPLILASN